MGACVLVLSSLSCLSSRQTQAAVFRTSQLSNQNHFWQPCPQASLLTQHFLEHPSLDYVKLTIKTEHHTYFGVVICSMAQGGSSVALMRPDSSSFKKSDIHTKLNKLPSCCSWDLVSCVIKLISYREVKMVALLIIIKSPSDDIGSYSVGSQSVLTWFNSHSNPSLYYCSHW